MKRFSLAVRRVSAPALILSALAALAVSGCGDDSRTNGLEQLSAGTVQARAVAALRSARSAHVRGTSLVAGNPAQIDLRFSGSSSSGAMTAEGVHFAFTRIGQITYIKASRRGLKKLGAPAPVRHVGADRWLKLAPRQVTLSGLSLAELGGQLAHNESPLDPHVSRATLDGKNVVVVTQQDGSKLYVANTGPPYPLHGDYKGPTAGRLEFTEYGTKFRITAPKNPLDISGLRARG